LKLKENHIYIFFREYKKKKSQEKYIPKSKSVFSHRYFFVKINYNFCLFSFRNNKVEYPPAVELPALGQQHEPPSFEAVLPVSTSLKDAPAAAGPATTTAAPLRELSPPVFVPPAFDPRPESPALTLGLQEAAPQLRRGRTLALRGRTSASSGTKWVPGPDQPPSNHEALDRSAAAPATGSPIATVSSQRTRASSVADRLAKAFKRLHLPQQ
jgi:hypothetical protein